ncbi:monooxygenase [Neisseria sp. Ec49-e6-T10]|uniref:monooxygenase n=1 Tax=Neisseria sp. Ec49-e6-T10 TaxID=3140744 RepID=UPI003EB74DDB
MAVILQITFKLSPAMLGENLIEPAMPLAQSITQEPGFISKIWTENPEQGEAGGIYLFDNRKSAQEYLDMHQKRMAQWGATDIDAKILDISQPLSKITAGPLATLF